MGAEDPEVNIIYHLNASQYSYQYLRKALAAGKHAQEESITPPSEELANDSLLKKTISNLEAMTIFHMPIYRKLSEIVASGKLGPLKVIR